MNTIHFAIRRLTVRLSKVLPMAAALGLSVSAPAAPPDLTNGGVPGDTISFNMGATGARGWVYHSRENSSESRQIQIKSVASGSPAAGILEASDVILGANGTGANPANFTSDARRALADAINDAEARNPATLKLIRWRAGGTDIVSITLQTMGAYSATAPYNCPKSALILQQGLQSIMAGETAGNYSFGTISLLAANNPADPNNAARLTRAQNEARALVPSAAVRAQMMADTRDATSMITWERGHKLIVMAEYYLLTGDAQVLPGIEAYAVNIAKNSSLFGTMGHIFAEKNLDGSANGPMGGQYGPVNSAGMPCFLGVLLARECGLTNPEITPAIERMSRFFAYYTGRGSAPYGEHEASWNGHENNGKSGLAALCFTLQNNRVTEGKFFAKMATAAGSERGEGHTGAFFNYTWAPLGAACGGEEAAASHFSRIRWMLDLNRRWDGGFDYDCLTGEGPNSGSQYNSFRMSTAALLTYALPLRQLRITGKNHDSGRWLTGADVTAAAAVDGYVATSSRTISQLIADLGNWSPMVQRRAADQLATRSIDTAILNQITALANDPSGSSRIGACLTLGKISNTTTANARAATLAALLTDPRNHVRFMAAEAMRNLPDSARLSQLNSILSAAASTATPLLPFDEEDPLHFAHGRLAMLLFYSGNAYGPKGVIYGSKINTPTVVNRSLLYPAIRAVAANPIGQARSTLTETYKNLTAADVNALASTLVDSIHFRAPSDKMFSAGIRDGGLFALEKYNIAEGVPLSKVYMLEDGRTDAYTSALGVLKKYAGTCTTVTPDPDIIGFCQSLLGGGSAAAAQAVLDAIAADTNPVTATPFKSIQTATADAASLNLPANQTTLRASASDLAQGSPIYTWRKVHGAGNVTFTPNGTAASKDAAAQFDNVPGKYLFEVTMSDSRGFTEVYKTVAVTLRNPDGTLPSNNPPTAYPQALSTNPASVKPITLTGGDPEGYAMVFSITSQPAHGTLSGTVPNLSYTSDAGYLGPDSFTFQVMDSEGQVSSATVSISVNAAGIELYAYEGFDYTPVNSQTGGRLAGKNGGTGWAGPWQDATSGSNGGEAFVYDSTGNVGYSGGFQPGQPNWDGIVNNLPESGGYAGLSSWSSTAAGNDRINSFRPLAQSAGAMAGADGVLWASVVVHYPNNGFYGHPGLALTSSGGYFTERSGALHTTSANGIGIGNGITGTNNWSDKDLNATFWSNGVSSAALRTQVSDISTSVDNIIIIKFEFGPTQDTVSTWFFTENQEMTEDAFNQNARSSTSSINESTLTTLTFSMIRAENAIDEIRLGNSFAAVIGVQGTPPDTTPPDLVNITDDRGGETMQQGTPVTYTLHFSEAMDVSTISASDFGNAGTSAVQINSLIQAVPGVVTVNITPVTPGTLQLHVLQGAVLKDLAGNLLNTATAITDDTIITVNPAMTNVPFVVGISQSEAETEITTAGLAVGVITNQHHTTIPAGEVLSQNPTGGASVAVGSPVDLVVSLGPAMTQVPNVIGLVQAAAEANITTVDLAVGTVTTENHATIPAGSVISQDPVGGATVVEGSAVNLVVSLGPVMVTVPNVTGIGQTAAEANITAAGLAVGTVTTQNDATVPVGDVISQNPAGGASVTEGSTVNLVVSLGPLNVRNHVIVDIPVSGTVAGTYANTHASDTIYQSITEIESAGGAQKNRYSYLEHKWEFNVTGGDTVTFHVEAHHTANNESDDFIFAYSTSGVNGTWQNMFMVTKTGDNDTAQSFVLPPGTSGTVHVRVLDTNRSRGRRSLDTLFIDEMFIVCQSSVSGGTPVTDEVVWASAYPGADLSDPAADFDSDGLSNGEERIWGLDPTSAVSSNPYAGAFDRTAGTFRYTRRDRALTGLTYSVWTSTDLVNWTEDLTAGQVPGEPNDKGVLTEDVTLSPELLANPSLFIQVRAAE